MSFSKRKRNIQSAVTLHDYFGSETSSSTKPTPTLRRKKLQKSTQSTILTQDIIVIESDSDSEPEILQVVQKTQKKRRLSGTSEEVEFVLDHKRPAGISLDDADIVKQSSKTPLLDKDIFEKTCSSPNSSMAPPTTWTVKETPVYSFGAPTLLLKTSTISHTTANLAPPPAPPSFVTPVFESLPTAEALLPPVSEKTPRDPNPPFDLFDDDWGTGDDETALVSLDADEVEVEESNSPEDIALTRCSSCNVHLRTHSQLGIEIHANGCLDFKVKLPCGVSPGSNFTSAIPPPKTHGPNINHDAGTGKVLTGNDAFSVLMSSHKENEAWKEISVVEDRTSHPTKNNGSRRKAPFYKVLQGMPIAVDAFRYGTIPGVNAYFLTHAHSDHYVGLTSNWKSGPIYCSEGTANLIIHMLDIDQKWVHPFPMDVPTIVPNTGGVSVTLIEANHCPGSCLFFFEGPQTVNAGDSAFKSPFVGSSKVFRYLHCGDFRASPQHVLHPAIKEKSIDHVYLDTTYLDSKYTFPPQPLVVSACADLVQRLVTGQSTTIKTKTPMDAWVKLPNNNKEETQAKTSRTLFAIGTYSIGKERIVKAIAHSLRSKVFCDPRKTAILLCQADPELHALLTSNPLEASVHLLPLGLVTSDKLKIYLERFGTTFSEVVGFRPTGWTYTPSASANLTPSVSSVLSSPRQDFTYASIRPTRQSTYFVQLFAVPYSEHSSFFELTCFAMSFNWSKMIATVNVGNENSRNKMMKWVARWQAERKKRGKDIIVPYRYLEYW